MTAAQKALDALEAAGKSGACPPWDAATLATNLSAPLAAVVRAAMERRSAEASNDWGCEAGSRIERAVEAEHAALDAFTVAAQEMFP